MRIAVATIVCLLSTAALAQVECKKERALTRLEQTFFERANGTIKALPAAPQGWAQHPEEVTAPAKLCTDVDPMFKKGLARLSVAAETEYLDPTDRTAAIDAAAKASQPTADETKKSGEVAKKLAKADGGSELARLQGESQKLILAQADRGTLLMHQAGLDAQARIRITFNPVSESSTGCGNQKTVTAMHIDGVGHAYSGNCDFSSNSGEPESGVLLLFGQWTEKLEGSTLEAAPAFDLKKAPHIVQAISVLITGDGKRPEELLKGLNVKALAALVGK